MSRSGPGEVIFYGILLWIAYRIFKTGIASYMGGSPQNTPPQQRWEPRRSRETVPEAGKSPAPQVGQEGYPADWPSRSAEVRKRDGYACVRCGATRELHVHHRVALSDGGTHDLTNLVTLCSRCHALVHPERPDLRTQTVNRGIGALEGQLKQSLDRIDTHKERSRRTGLRKSIRTRRAFKERLERAERLESLNRRSLLRLSCPHCGAVTKVQPEHRTEAVCRICKAPL